MRVRSLVAVALFLGACSRREGSATQPDASVATAGAGEAALSSSAPIPPAGMTFVPGGTFAMGTDVGASFEGPTRPERVHPFFLDVFEVTNEAFERFATASNHVTTAEKSGVSSVFDLRTHAWAVVPRANWRSPEGSSARGRARDPVVQVSWSDDDEYCRWTGGRLPTEIEWERAARGGVESARFPWGNDDVGTKDRDGRPRANVWQGRFPDHDDGSDGFRGLAPVGSFAPNSFGLFDMAGNVWEWTDAFFDAKSDAKLPSAERERVIRGGSWLCSATHCVGYRTAARGKAIANEGTNHIGFRCARDP